MNILNESHKDKQDIVIALDTLYKKDVNKFYFIKALMESIINKEEIKISLTLDRVNPIVTILLKNYEYKEEFNDIQESTEFINLIKSIKKEVA